MSDEPPPSKRGAPEGNKNAAKDDGREAVLNLRVLPEEKKAWVDAARAEGLKLSVWVRRRLNGETG